MYISCLVTITQALLSLGSDGHVLVVPRYLFIILLFRLLGRNYSTAPATILTYSSRLIHIHTTDYTRTLLVSTHLMFLKNLTNGRPLPALPLTSAMYVYTLQILNLL